ncbi:MAG: ABC transporter ATP-binding protein [Hyphomicrobiales bacterium]|nr:ABC transporter ATP-binding protein [Hyphomicrobiales bacterium]
MTIVVEHISHSFGSLNALSDVSFQIEPGEVFGIVGPSGCGKSTLLSIIGGILKPSAGRVLVNSDAKGNLNPLTFVFQDFSLLPWRTGEGNVSFGLEHLAISRKERDSLVADALARTRLSEFARYFPKQLSGGMRQRVGLARALAVRPLNMLMDEPLSALDSQTREILMADLADVLNGTGLSVAYVTHNLDEAVRLADRIAVFSRRPGRIKEIVTIPLAREERTGDAAMMVLSTQARTLWDLIRDEAATADREILDA